jgi:hypothetical protein
MRTMLPPGHNPDAHVQLGFVGNLKQWGIAFGVILGIEAVILAVRNLFRDTPLPWSEVGLWWLGTAGILLILLPVVSGYSTFKEKRNHKP